MLSRKKAHLWHAIIFTSYYTDTYTISLLARGIKMKLIFNQCAVFRIKTFFVSCIIASSLAAAETDIPAPSSFHAVAATAAHIQLLKQGGLVIYMRHGRTDPRFPDMIPVNLDDCDSQRPLSDAGRQLLDQIGISFAKLQIPYRTVISSPFCRAKESAKRVFGEHIKVDIALRYTAAMPDAEKQPAVERTLKWISKSVEEQGYNRIVVAHGPNIAEIMDYLPPESTMIIFRPLGAQGFAYIASIEPNHWPALLQELELE